MVVLKFGGSSVRDAGMIGAVIEIAKSRLDRAPVLVSSAMGDTTDSLVEIATAAAGGEDQVAGRIIDDLNDSHLATARALTGGVDGDLEGNLGELFQELRSLVQGIFLIRECSPRSYDTLLSFGERLSTTLIAAAARREGIHAHLVDARTLLRTDSNYGAATPDMETTARLCSSNIKPRVGELWITQGFIASDPDGVTTTLGRGGSDYTATILGACLEADEVEIWTDVNGIMTADPRVITTARTIPVISYDEAAELAYFGAKVVHPYTILPAVTRSIPVWVKNTSRPEQPGTQIQARSDGAGVRAMASKGGITLVTVQSSRMLNAYGFLRALFAVFDKHQVSVDLVATSEVSVSVTVDHGVPLDGVVSDLEELGEVTVEPDQAIVCLVGRELFNRTGFLAAAFDSIDPVPVRMISLGSSDINLSLVVAQENTEAVLKSLHQRLFGE